MSPKDPAQEAQASKPSGGGTDTGPDSGAQTASASTTMQDKEEEAEASSDATKLAEPTKGPSKNDRKGKEKAARDSSSSKAADTSEAEPSGAAIFPPWPKSQSLYPNSRNQAPGEKALPDPADLVNAAETPLPEGGSPPEGSPSTSLKSALQEQPTSGKVPSGGAVGEQAEGKTGEQEDAELANKRSKRNWLQRKRGRALYWELSLYFLSVLAFLVRTRFAFLTMPRFTAFAFLQLLWHLCATFYYISSGTVRMVMRALDKSFALSHNIPDAIARFWQEVRTSFLLVSPKAKKIATVVTAFGFLLHIASIPYIGKLVPSVSFEDDVTSGWYARLGKRSAPVEHIYEIKSKFKDIQDRSAKIATLSGIIMDECSALRYGDVLLDENIFSVEASDASLLSSRGQLSRTPALLSLRSSLSVFEGPPPNVKPRDVQAPDQITDLQDSLSLIAKNHSERIRLFKTEILAVDKARRLGSFFLPFFTSHAWESKSQRSSHAKWNALAAFYTSIRPEIYELYADSHFRHSLLSGTFAANRRLLSDNIWISATKWQGRLLWLRWRLWQLRTAAKLLRMRLSRDPSVRESYRALPPATFPFASTGAPPRIPFEELKLWERQLDSVAALTRDIASCEVAMGELKEVAKGLYETLPDREELENMRDAMVKLEVPDAPAWPWARGQPPLMHALVAIERQVPGWRYALMTWTRGPSGEKV